MAKDATAEKQKPKRPQAKKRDIQSLKRRIANKSLQATINTAIRNYSEVLKSKDSTAIQASLNEVFSLLDKGINKGIYKLNTASRKKGNLAKKAAL